MTGVQPHPTVIDHRQKLRALEQHNDFPADMRALLDHAVERRAGTFLLNFFDQGYTRTAEALRDDVYRAAQGLRGLGVERGSHVAFLMPNRIEFPIAWLAVQVLGAVVVPASTASTGAELEIQLTDADATFLIATSTLADEHAKSLAATAIHTTIKVGADGPGSWDQIINHGDPAWRPEWEISDSDGATIQYTSGSTGLPKGCLLTQRSWIVFGCAPAATSAEPYNNILCAHPWFYVDPGWHLVMALYSGARIHMAEKLSGSKFVDRVRNWDVEFSLFPRPLVGVAGEESDRHLPLRTVAALGASPAALADIETRFGCRAINPFGMTEAGTVLRLPDDCDDPAAVGSCGVPGLYREVRIVDGDGNRCGSGEPGELQVRGDGLFAGYYKRPDADSEAFVDGWFRTGDLFIEDERGYFWIVGRLKDIIRRSSQNISALEVEQCLVGIEGVHQAAVVSVPDDYRGEEAKAYLLLQPGIDPDDIPPHEVRSQLRDSLSEYKVPRFIAYVDAFPYTASSKISKVDLLRGVDDLRSGAWDAETERWLP